eukprot:1153567-Pelagomonas_calceolata.AAC.1
MPTPQELSMLGTLRKGIWYAHTLSMLCAREHNKVYREQEPFSETVHQFFCNGTPLRAAATARADGLSFKRVGKFAQKQSQDDVGMLVLIRDCFPDADGRNNIQFVLRSMSLFLDVGWPTDHATFLNSFQTLK